MLMMGLKPLFGIISDDVFETFVSNDADDVFETRILEVTLENFGSNESFDRFETVAI